MTGVLQLQLLLLVMLLLMMMLVRSRREASLRGKCVEMLLVVLWSPTASGGQTNACS